LTYEFLQENGTPMMDFGITIHSPKISFDEASLMALRFAKLMGFDVIIVGTANIRQFFFTKGIS